MTRDKRDMIKAYTVLIDAMPELGHLEYAKRIIEDVMKFSEIKSTFDPTDRLRDGKFLVVTLTPEDWCKIETSVGKRVAREEIRELIMGVFAGKFKIVKR